MLVSTVTAMTSGGGVPVRAAVSCAASPAASIIVLPPAACTLTIQHAERRGGGDRLRDGIRDVVKLQVEEDAIALVDQRAHDRRALRGEQAAADLESAGDAAQRVRQRERLRRRSRHRARLRS